MLTMAMGCSRHKFQKLGCIWTRCIWTFRGSDVGPHLRSVMPALNYGEERDEEVLWVHTTARDRWCLYETLQNLYQVGTPDVLLLTCHPSALANGRCSRGLFGYDQWARGFPRINPWTVNAPLFVLAGRISDVHVRVASSVNPPMFQLYFYANALPWRLCLIL